MLLFETEATGLVAKVIERAPVRGRLSLIWGSHGIGKSSAVDLAAMDRSWVRRLALPPAGEKPTPRGFYVELASELGVPIGRGWSAGQVVREVVGYCRDEGLTVVLDQCDKLRQWELDAVRYLTDRLGHLVMAGGTAMLTKVSHHPQLRACCRLPFEMPAMSASEAQRVFGERFSREFLSQLVELRGGILHDITTVIEGFEQRGAETRSLGAEDAEMGIAQWLLRGSEVATQAAKRAA